MIDFWAMTTATKEFDTRRRSRTTVGNPTAFAPAAPQIHADFETISKDFLKQTGPERSISRQMLPLNLFDAFSTHEPDLC